MKDEKEFEFDDGDDNPFKEVEIEQDVVISDDLFDDDDDNPFTVNK